MKRAKHRPKGRTLLVVGTGESQVCRGSNPYPVYMKKKVIPGIMLALVGTGGIIYYMSADQLPDKVTPDVSFMDVMGPRNQIVFGPFPNLCLCQDEGAMEVWSACCPIIKGQEITLRVNIHKLYDMDRDLDVDLYDYYLMQQEVK